MVIEHLALLTKDLERLKQFYEKHFGASCGEKYQNLSRGFSSYFLEFDSGARLEIMSYTDETLLKERLVGIGIHHFCFEVKTSEEVEHCMMNLEKAEVHIVEKPRYSGLGDYVGTFCDPDGNRIEVLKRANKEQNHSY